MDGKFAAMHRTVLLLKKYGQILPEKTQFLFNAAPGRWNNLKTKVSLAKQRLGPRIQEESASITVVSFKHKIWSVGHSSHVSYHLSPSFIKLYLSFFFNCYANILIFGNCLTTSNFFFLSFLVPLFHFQNIISLKLSPATKTSIYTFLFVESKTNV